MKNPLDEEKNLLFLGATELAMLDLLRQEYVENEAIKPIFVVDFPRLAQAHCIPPLNLSMPEVTGLLPSPEKSVVDATRTKGTNPKHDLKLIKGLAAKYAETLGLAEVLSRFVFSSAWSDGAPKLMLSTQTAEAASIEDALSRQSLEEWSSTASRKGVDRALEEFTKLYREPGKSIEDFVKEVADKAEELLPSIYGEYSQVRQFLRFEDIKPVADEDFIDRPVVYAQSIAELRAGFDELDDNKEGVAKFRVLRTHWEKAIPDTSRHDMDPDLFERININRGADVNTMATIEYLNDRLAEMEVHYRLVYMSDDEKLFDGALRRFRVIDDHRFNPQRTKGPVSAFHRSRYAAHLLLAEPDSNLRKVPLLDPRVLLTGRSFVEFSVAGGEKESGVEPVRAITEWLPFFFDGRERDKRAVANTYLNIQHEPNREGSAPMTSDMFEMRQYKALETHWKEYVRMVGTAHGLTRYSTRAHLRDVFIALAKNDKSAMESAIHQQLDKAMSAWLPAMGGPTLLVRLKKMRGTTRIRSVPPLLMPAWPVVQHSLVFLLSGDNNRLGREENPELKWITKPTVENLGLSKDWKNTPDWKLNYVQLLGMAYGFASEENWTASYRLASSAFSLAELRRDSLGEPDESFVSGREAAYLASVSARRSLASRPIFVGVPNFERNLIVRLRNAVKLESPLFEANRWQLRRDAHDLRVMGEELSWRAYRQLCVIMRNQVRGRFNSANLELFPVRSDIELDTWKTCESVLRLREVFRSKPECEANHDYFVTLSYLGRQLMLNLLQIEVFGILASDAPANNEETKSLKKVLKALTDFAPLQSGVRDVQLPWSCFENHVLMKALSFAGYDNSNSPLASDLYVDNRLATDGKSEESSKPQEYSLSEWRLKMLMRSDLGSM